MKFLTVNYPVTKNSIYQKSKKSTKTPKPPLGIGFHLWEHADDLKESLTKSADEKK